ncbi:hypothetical protein BDGGKGIB_02324 [Nodularia sphaerocarpa UHCC 0038]|nr:hypothetical protein BDGGKGIB_02324 [Nodularia sphaerocarpa UHCC 0038]
MHLGDFYVLNATCVLASIMVIISETAKIRLVCTIKGYCAVD